MTELISAKYLSILCAAIIQLNLKVSTGLAEPIHRFFQLPSYYKIVMIPYFAVMVILLVYGMHRSWLVLVYFLNRHKAPVCPPDPIEWPRVTVQLPIYNERYVIERLVDAVALFDYPLDRLEIQVLDDSTDDTQEIARACVERYQALGLPIHYLHRSDRTGFKAGALAAGLDSATGELIAIFDADFLPTPDFLRRAVPYLTDPRIGMIQTRWTYLNRDYSVLTKVEALMLDGFFGMEHLSRSRSGVFFNFTGTAGVWRRAAIDEAGGWEHDTLTEDIDLSYRAQLCGWRLLYMPEIECPSELPVEMTAFKEQQARWSKGSMQVGIKLLPRLLRSKQSFRIKAEAFLHLTGAITCPFMLVLTALLLPSMIVRFNQDWVHSNLADIPSAVLTFSVYIFYSASQRVLYPRNWKRAMLYLPVMLGVGFALSLRLSKAVIEAIWGVKSDFVRTPKLNIAGPSESWHGKKYRTPAGWLPYFEIAFGLYFAFTIVYLALNRNYRAIPFLLLFVWGFLYTGILSLGQVWWKRKQPVASQTPIYSVSSAVSDDPAVFAMRDKSGELTCQDTASIIENRTRPPQILD